MHYKASALVGLDCLQIKVFGQFYHFYNREYCRLDVCIKRNMHHITFRLVRSSTCTLRGTALRVAGNISGFLNNWFKRKLWKACNFCLLYNEAKLYPLIHFCAVPILASHSWLPGKSSALHHPTKRHPFQTSKIQRTAKLHPFLEGPQGVKCRRIVTPKLVLHLDA